MSDAHTSARHILAVVNPTSGRKRYRRIKRIAEELSRGPHALRLLETRQAGDARRAVSEMNGDVDCIVSAGGDGTLREVLAGLGDRDVPVAIIPLGTANIVARAMGIPVDIAGSSRLARTGLCERMDMGRCDHGPFLACAGAGFDAAAVHAFMGARDGNTTITQYVRPVVKTLLKYDFPRFTVVCDGREITDRATTIIVGNTPVYGGPATPTPNATPFDGRFDVTIFTARTIPGFVMQMGSACFQTHDLAPGVTTLRARRVECRCDADVPLQLDGDSAGWLPAVFEVAPMALRLVTPHGKGEI